MQGEWGGGVGGGGSGEMGTGSSTWPDSYGSCEVSGARDAVLVVSGCQTTDRSLHSPSVSERSRTAAALRYSRWDDADEFVA